MKSRVLKYRHIFLFVSLLFRRFFYLEAESKQEKQGGILEIGRKTLKYKERVFFSILQTVTVRSLKPKGFISLGA